MQTAGIRDGDIIEYNVRGQLGHALVTEPLHSDPTLKRQVITIAPLGVRDFLPTRNVTSRQIREHWRKRRTKGAAPNGISNGE